VAGEIILSEVWNRASKIVSLCHGGISEASIRISTSGQLHTTQYTFSAPSLPTRKQRQPMFDEGSLFGPHWALVICAQALKGNIGFNRLDIQRFSISNFLRILHSSSLANTSIPYCFTAQFS
jgi:hypothetical protein